MTPRGRKMTPRCLRSLLSDDVNLPLRCCFLSVSVRWCGSSMKDRHMLTELPYVGASSPRAGSVAAFHTLISASRPIAPGGHKTAPICLLGELERITVLLRGELRVICAYPIALSCMRVLYRQVQACFHRAAKPVPDRFTGSLYRIALLGHRVVVHLPTRCLAVATAASGVQLLFLPVSVRWCGSSRKDRHMLKKLPYIGASSPRAGPDAAFHA